MDDLTNAPPEMGGARCALHSEAASFTCSRCGNFACDRCQAVSDTRLCQSCETRAAPQALPPGRPITVGGLLGDVFRQFSRNLLAIGLLAGFSLLSTVAAVLMFAALSGAPALQSLAEGGSPFLSRGFIGPLLVTLVLWAYLQCAGVAGFIRWIADGMRARGERSVRVLVRAGLAGGAVLFLVMVLYGVLAWGTTALSDYLISLMGVLGVLTPLIQLSTMLLAFFVIFYASLISSLSPASAVLEGLGPLDAFRRSGELVKGHRMRLLGVYAILGVLTFGGVVINLMATAILASLSNLQVVASFLTILLQSMTVSLFLLASTAAYVRLRPEEELPPASQEAPAAVQDTPAQSESGSGEVPSLFRQV